MAPGSCSIEACDKSAYCRGWCRRHYRRWERTGDPHFPPTRRQTVPPEVRFWTRVEKGDPDECWPWRGHVMVSGYGRIRFGGRSTLAHRLAYELTLGPIPDGLVPDHTCHTEDASCVGGSACLHRRCCNPSHMEPVTPEENTRRGWTRRRELVNDA
jgi:hypothetical protein